MELVSKFRRAAHGGSSSVKQTWGGNGEKNVSAWTLNEGRKISGRFSGWSQSPVYYTLTHRISPKEMESRSLVEVQGNGL